MKIRSFKTPSEIAEALAGEIITAAENNIAATGRFNFVLTGGSSPKALYQLLSTKYRLAINWQKVYFFFGDERYVPASDKDYNGLMAKETLLDPLGITDNNIFYVNTHLMPEVAAVDYFERIRDHFNSKPVIFDFILLGMGDDAHTASMFPQTTILESQTAHIEAVFVAKLDTWRISFTAKLINQAKEIAFLVFGANKANALQHVRSETGDYHDYPSKLISPSATWYVDQQALGK